MVRRPWSSLVTFTCSSFLSRLAQLRARRRQYRRGLKLRRRESRFLPVAAEVPEPRCCCPNRSTVAGVYIPAPISASRLCRRRLRRKECVPAWRAVHILALM